MESFPAILGPGTGGSPWRLPYHEHVPGRHQPDVVPGSHGRVVYTTGSRPAGRNPGHDERGRDVSDDPFYGHADDGPRRRDDVGHEKAHANEGFWSSIYEHASGTARRET